MNDLTKINMRVDTHYAFLFTDIEGSTKRWAMYPAAMGAALARHDAVLRAVVREAGGAVFKTTGDGGCAVFASVGAALEAAARLQIRLGEEDFAAVDGLKFRMGVHSGPAEFRDDDYFGLTLGRTARIMAAGHGGQILVSATASLAGSAPERYALRSLGAHQLKDLGEAEAIYQLTGPGLEGKFPPLRALNSKPNNLPFQLSSFIGRETELAAMRGLLAAHKLITLLGTGGIGKTRFALQVAADALDAYADGVWFVELAGLGQGEQVAPAVASALNITLSGSGNPVAQLASALRGATMLIVLDNCEHVIEAAATLSGAVLEKNAGITVLATSRSPLGLPGEQSFALPTLSVPEASAVSGMTAEIAAGYAGIRLFVERAALVQPGFRLEGENASDIAAICQRLDGIALAIELAAARVRLMRPRDLLARLKDRFRLLTGSARTHLPRQQTLRALIDWSFALLDEAERVVFRRLGVFAGSFDLAGAEAVVPGGPIEPEAVLDLVMSLLDKSLIIRLPGTEREPRYRLLESTRDYALEKLAEAGETASLRRAHARHVVAVFGAARCRLADTDAVVWERSIEPEVENLRASLAWAFGDGGDDGIAIALAAHLRPLVLSNLIDQRTRFAFVRAAAKKLTPETPGEDAAWIWIALASDRSTSARVQADAAERARALFEALGNRQMVGVALAQAAIILALAGDAGGVEHCADAARAILPTTPANLNKAWTLVNLGSAKVVARGDAADLAAANSGYAAALEIYERFNAPAGVLFVSVNLAEIQARRGEYQAAIKLATRNAAEHRSRRYWFRLAHDLMNLTGYYLLAQNNGAASVAAREVLPLLEELDDQQLWADSAGKLALLAARAGALAMAASFKGHENHYYVSNEQPRQTVEQRVHEALMGLFAAAEADGTLSGAKRVQLMETGAAMTAEEVQQLGRTVLAKIG